MPQNSYKNLKLLFLGAVVSSVGYFSTGCDTVSTGTSDETFDLLGQGFAISGADTNNPTIYARGSALASSLCGEGQRMFVEIVFRYEPIFEGNVLAQTNFANIDVQSDQFRNNNIFVRVDGSLEIKNEIGGLGIVTGDGVPATFVKLSFNKTQGELSPASPSSAPSILRGINNFGLSTVRLLQTDQFCGVGLFGEAFENNENDVMMNNIELTSDQSNTLAETGHLPKNSELTDKQIEMQKEMLESFLNEPDSQHKINYSFIY